MTFREVLHQYLRLNMAHPQGHSVRSGCNGSTNASYVEGECPHGGKEVKNSQATR